MTHSGRKFCERAEFVEYSDFEDGMKWQKAIDEMYLRYDEEHI